MYQVHGYIRDYNATTDTCSVEFTSLNSIDTWLDGVQIDLALDRHWIAAGAQAVIVMPDLNRLCEARVVAVVPPQAAQSSAKVQQGRQLIGTNGAGSGTVTVTFPSAYTASPPQVSLQADGLYTTAITSVTLSAFAMSISGAPANSGVVVTWTATGV